MLDVDQMGRAGNRADIELNFAVAGSAGAGSLAPGRASRDCKTTLLKGRARIDTRRFSLVQKIRNRPIGLALSRDHPVRVIHKAFRQVAGVIISRASVMARELEVCCC